MGKNNFGDKVHELTPENRKNGGYKSVETRKAKKQLRESLQAFLNGDVHDKNGNTMTGNEALALKAFQAAMKGDWKAWELVRDTSGQKPVDKIIVAEVEPEVIDEVERIVEETKNEE